MIINVDTNISLPGGRRLTYPLWLCSGIVGVVLLAWLIIPEGYLIGPGREVLTLLLPVWLGGLAIAALNPAWLSHWGNDVLVLPAATWCNAGAVMLAVLAPEKVRLVLLAVPMFSLLYAALHLSRSRLIALVLATGLAYVLVVLYLSFNTPMDAAFEAFSGAYFALMLGGISVLSREILQLRDGLLERNHGLREAMERLQDLALKDELTGLHNRRYIMEVLSRQRALAQRSGQQFTLCYCDLDHFKTINDLYGHAVGDVALREFGKCAQTVVRNVDYVARFGGEEFLLILSGADQRTAQRVATRLCARTRRLWVPGTEDGFEMTVSVGIAAYLPGESIDDLLNRADRALYAAKSDGRDGIVVASP